jgi:hypothetical protein
MGSTTASGTVKPTTHLLDNKALAAYKAEIKKNCKNQLVPPDNHRMNLVECATQTFKNHFKAVIAGVDKTTPCNYGTGTDFSCKWYSF